MLPSHFSLPQSRDVVQDALVSPEAICLSSLLHLLDGIAECLLDLYADRSQLAIVNKADKSPLTHADQLSHNQLRDGLRRLAVGIPLISEESSESDLRKRREWPICWMVDPLDGTREFLDGTDAFSVNVALIVKGRPVLGVITVPCMGCHFIGVVGEGAYRIQLGGLSSDGQRLHCRSLDSASPLVMLASARHRESTVSVFREAIEGSLNRPTRRLNRGAALKFCDLVLGRADVYPRTTPCYEWDVAAGDALVCAAGGAVVDFEGQPLRYNDGHTLLAPPFIAQADPAIRYDWALR
jgi:3'(2'), 5'-bisphosphate nucleotidase